jgi:uncharacterized membrane protein SpoIIM required for sporulation
MHKAYWAGVIVRNAILLSCLLIAAASGLEQSWRYGALGEAFAGQSYPNCPTPEQIAERAANG